MAARQNMASCPTMKLQLIALDEHQPRTHADQKMAADTCCVASRDSERKFEGGVSEVARAGWALGSKAVRGLGVPDDVLYHGAPGTTAIGMRTDVDALRPCSGSRCGATGPGPGPQTHDGPMPEVEMIAPYPSYTFDWHTQEGQARAGGISPRWRPARSPKLIQHQGWVLVRERQAAGRLPGRPAVPSRGRPAGSAGWSGRAGELLRPSI